MSEQRVQELPPQIEEFMDAYLNHKPEEMASLYAPDCHFAFPGIDLRGRDQIERLWTAWFEALPDVTSDILRAPSLPGLFALEWEERGTHLGRLRLAGFDLPPSGRKLRWRGVSIYSLGDAGFDSAIYYADRLQIPLQLGTPRSIPALAIGGFRLWRNSRR
jgi:uncharacterized protein (TIGR02246 family)